MRLPFPARLAPDEQVFLAQRLAFLLEGGIPLLTALAMLGEHLRTERGRRLVGAVRAEVLAGSSLTDAFTRNPGATNPQSLTMLRVGESCGTLGQSLQIIARDLLKQQRLRNKIVGSLTYPAIVVVASLGIAVYLTTSLLPKLLPVFQGLNAPLPMSTRAVLAVSGFVRARGWLLLAGIAGVSVGAVGTLARLPRARLACAGVLLRLPIVGRLLRAARVAEFCRSSSSLLLSGMHIREACLASVSLQGHALYDGHFHAMAAAINEGAPLSSYLRRHPRFFPPLLAQMIAAGESSGKLPESLSYLAEHFERDIDHVAEQLSILLEPALMLCTGAMVGFIAIAVISPMYALTQSLHA